MLYKNMSEKNCWRNQPETGQYPNEA